MYNKRMISLEQAQNAITAIADFNRDPDRRKVDMAAMPETCWPTPGWTAA